MNDCIESAINEPQCQYFVVRKKRLCRMTVRPGRHYCGEHEPLPRVLAGGHQVDTRIPCPNDPKHTCYASKLTKHLTICNARLGDTPPYIVHNINAPEQTGACQRCPLSQISKETVLQVLDKVNVLYDKYIKHSMEEVAERPIHATVVEEFSQMQRTESSLRHLRQTSSLLHLAEDEGLVQDDTCYVELGAGKGQLSYQACTAWCSPASRSHVLLVDRASLRHKRDNKLPAPRAARLRADLRHLALRHAPPVAHSARLVGLAKHLCGAATDYALRCLTADGVAHKTHGLVLATCCHHRCESAVYVGARSLQELDITGEDLNVMLGVVSWATCGDGRARDRRPATAQHAAGSKDQYNDPSDSKDQNEDVDATEKNCGVLEDDVVKCSVLSQEDRECAGRRVKALLDWGRVLFLRERGLHARLCRYVSRAVSPENLCIVATRAPTAFNMCTPSCAHVEGC